MRKLCLLFLPFICSFKITVGQPRSAPYTPPPTYLREVFSTAVVPKQYAGIDGTPFLTDAWLLARIRINPYKIIDSVSIKLNLYERRLHVLSEKGEELQSAIAFEEVDIIDTNQKWHNAIFLPGIGRDREAFFQLMTDGKKMKLVKKLIVDKWESKSVGTEVQRRFGLDERLYLFFNDELYKTSKSCSAIDIFKDYPGVQKFISTNNIKCNKEDDLMKLVTYFNSL